MIIGGAEDKYNERRLLRKFVSLAGEQAARILIIPIASDYPEFSADVYTQAFRKLGLQHVSVLRATSRQDIIDVDAAQLLKDVTGVFISGGDQMRLVSLLGGSEFARLLEQRVRQTPLVLAGTSAGAAGMSATMIVRGEAVPHPQKNTLRLSPGLGLLHNIIIDQHFSERGRLSRLITAVSYNPRQLGIGIDENTAIIVAHDGTLEVHGQGTATIVDGSRISYNDIAEVQEEQPFAVTGVQLHILREGMRYDFTRRAPVPVTEEFLLPDI